MKMSYLSRTVFGSLLMATVLLPGWSEPGKPSAVAPVASAQETQVNKAIPASKQPAQGGGKKAERVGSVDDKALVNAAGNTANWLMYGRTYDANRYSPLDQINKKNVKRLIPVWTF